MPSLTELLGKPVRDPNGDVVAKLQDLVVQVNHHELATPSAGDSYPPVTGIVARIGARGAQHDIFIPWEHVLHMGRDGVDLTTPVISMLRFTRRDGEIVLSDGLFDKQVVDVEGRRVVRVNDVDLTERDGLWYLVGVDVSPGGLLRRMGMQRLSRRLPRAPVINWAQVVPVADRLDDGGTLRLRVPRDKLALMQPAELARVVEQLTPQEGADLLNDLDEAQAADTIEELEDEQQGQILRAMDPERAADVLEEMEPDEAVDALSSMSQEEATDLLGRMSREDADEVQELLGYPEDSAGGLMTTYYVSVPDWASVGEVRAALRRQTKLADAEEEEDPLPDAMPEIYVVHEANGASLPRGGRQSSRPRPSGKTAQVADRAPSVWTEGKLAGVVTLRDLLLAEPDTLISAVMHPTQVGHALDKEQDVARRIAEDDLLALPIVDDSGMLLGIVTVDDAMDVILPTSWKKRLPRVFH